MPFKSDIPDYICRTLVFIFVFWFESDWSFKKNINKPASWAPQIAYSHEMVWEEVAEY